MFSALLDTCVLVPSRARDVLLEIASTGAYRPLRGPGPLAERWPGCWSTEIFDELDRTLRTLLGKRGTSPEEIDAYLTCLTRQMKTAFPDALVTDWEPLVPTIHLPDPDDRHVVAAARTGRADVIVTDNLADFPPSALPAPLIRQSLDDFLLDELDLHPGQVVTAVHAVASRTGRSGPAMTAHDVATYLRAHGTPAFGDRLLATLTNRARSS
ncbi:PIN domain-containing protein [Frankia sp. Cr1]|uniref:PIN domain-containing protein n=1 Tax=Frankia sp. Cr1 TaxID=3073931 RepID=UPI002AD3AD90|nr:PIN domain-containing protein [Frankia sp. Cr1]